LAPVVLRNTDTGFTDQASHNCDVALVRGSEVDIHGVVVRGARAISEVLDVDGLTWLDIHPLAIAVEVVVPPPTRVSPIVETHGVAGGISERHVDRAVSTVEVWIRWNGSLIIDVVWGHGVTVKWLGV